MSHGHLEIPGTQGTCEEPGGTRFTKWFWGFSEPSELVGSVGLCPKRQKEAGGLFPTTFEVGVLPGLSPAVPVKCTYLGALWGRWAAMGEYFNALT